MKIAQVAPLYESVPATLYGGTERVVSYLTEELVSQGHEVTLFASGDSETEARLVKCTVRALRLDNSCVDPHAHHILMLERVMREADEFDLIHFHIDYLHFPFSRRCLIPQVTTLHGRLDIPDLVPIYKEFNEMPVISISKAQRRPLSWINWVGNVYHGLPRNLHTFRPEPGQYLAFLGRISPEKRCDRAIEIAQRAGMPLKIAAKIDRADRDYYETEIKPLLGKPGIEFLGEIGKKEKNELLGNAYAYLFPIDWPEPFGLTMIESLACGTPVIAYPCGSVPEILEDGVTGYLVRSQDEAVRAVAQIPQLSRKACRQSFEQRFTAERMAADYVARYQELVAAITDKPAPRRTLGRHYPDQRPILRSGYLSSN